MIFSHSILVWVDKWHTQRDRHHTHRGTDTRDPQRDRHQGPTEGQTPGTHRGTDTRDPHTERGTDTTHFTLYFHEALFFYLSFWLRICKFTKTTTNKSCYVASCPKIKTLTPPPPPPPPPMIFTAVKFIPPVFHIGCSLLVLRGSSNFFFSQ